jgi:hypothetical protein
MPAFATALSRMRHSVLGAWLAVAYALAVLAAGLAPQAAMAHQPLAGTILCSGQGLAGDETPQPQTPSEPSHCKGCPLFPALDLPGSAQLPSTLRHAQPVAQRAPASLPFFIAPACDLPPPRAPPAV